MPATDQNLSDTLVLSDAALDLIGIVPIGSADSLVLSDSVPAPLLSVAIKVSDALALLDTVQFTILRNSRSVSDTLNFADSVKTFYTVVTAAADAITLSDAIGLSLIGALSDSLVITDGITFKIGGLILPTSILVRDSLQLFDSIQLGVPAFQIAVGDTLNFQDGIFPGLPLLGSTTSSYLRRYLNDVV